MVATLVLGGMSAAGGVAHADPPPPPPAAPKTTIDADGTFVVGKDIAPGTYGSAGPVGDGTCYWKRSDAAGDMIDNAMTHKSQVVAIAPTDASFKTRGCQAWALTDAAPPAATPPMLGGLQARILLGTINGLAGGVGQLPAPPPAPADPAAPAPVPPPTP